MKTADYWSSRRRALFVEGQLAFVFTRATWDLIRIAISLSNRVFRRMILSETSATFRNHALSGRAAQFPSWSRRYRTWQRGEAGRGLGRRAGRVAEVAA